MIIYYYTHPTADNLPIQNLIARQLPTNTHTHTHMYTHVHTHITYRHTEYSHYLIMYTCTYMYVHIWPWISKFGRAYGYWLYRYYYGIRSLTINRLIRLLCRENTGRRNRYRIDQSHHSDACTMYMYLHVHMYATSTYYYTIIWQGIHDPISIVA